MAKECVNLEMVSGKNGLCKPDEWTAQQNLTDPSYRCINIRECESKIVQTDV